MRASWKKGDRIALRGDKKAVVAVVADHYLKAHKLWMYTVRCDDGRLMTVHPHKLDRVLKGVK